jgi:hypothetical protein
MTWCRGSNDDHIFVECTGVVIVLRNTLMIIDRRSVSVMYAYSFGFTWKLRSYRKVFQEYPKVFGMIREVSLIIGY